MRRVHDIVYGHMGKARLPVAFIQHGKPEDGSFIYENVCPFCAQTLEKVTAHPDAEMTAVLNRLLMGVTRHYPFCVHRGTGTLLVEKTEVPLGTERIIREH